MPLLKRICVYERIADGVAVPAVVQQMALRIRFLPSDPAHIRPRPITRATPGGARPLAVTQAELINQAHYRPSVARRRKQFAGARVPARLSLIDY